MFIHEGIFLSNFGMIINSGISYRAITAIVMDRGQSDQIVLNLLLFYWWYWVWILYIVNNNRIDHVIILLMSTLLYMIWIMIFNPEIEIIIVNMIIVAIDIAMVKIIILIFYNYDCMIESQVDNEASIDEMYHAIAVNHSTADHYYYLVFPCRRKIKSYFFYNNKLQHNNNNLILFLYFLLIYYYLFTIHSPKFFVSAIFHIWYLILYRLIAIIYYSI